MLPCVGPLIHNPLLPYHALFLTFQTFYIDIRASEKLETRESDGKVIGKKERQQRKNHPLPILPSFPLNTVAIDKGELKSEHWSSVGRIKGQWERGACHNWAVFIKRKKVVSSLS